jgi:hypothetical protein
MPRKQIDYSKTVFYKVACLDQNVREVFVGFTTNIAQRKHTLKRACAFLSQTKHSATFGETVRKNGGWENWRMEIIEIKSCKDQNEANAVKALHEKALHKKAFAKETAHTCHCGRVYKHIQSYRRHLKECDSHTHVVEHTMHDQDKDDLRNMINTLVHQNQEMRQMVREMIPKIGNTTINKFNLQVFLNETCKNAINMSEFIGSLELQLADLDDTRRNGYVRGIANIFVRELRKLEQHERPIHCSDLKREVLYVKDNDAWEKDNEERALLRQAIEVVSKKQINKIKDWEDANPGWKESEAGRQMYIDIIRSVTDSERDVTGGKIIKSIAKEVTIDK